MKNRKRPISTFEKISALYFADHLWATEKNNGEERVAITSTSYTLFTVQDLGR